MAWDDDPLQYGYILSRLPNGDWWHLHICRGSVAYDCLLLGRRTEVFACVQQFGPWAVARTPRFVLTLDGVNVDRPAAELTLDGHWGERPAEAEHFQRSVMPVLYDSVEWQRALRDVISRHTVPPA